LAPFINLTRPTKIENFTVCISLLSECHMILTSPKVHLTAVTDTRRTAMIIQSGMSGRPSRTILLLTMLTSSGHPDQSQPSKHEARLTPNRNTRLTCYLTSVDDAYACAISFLIQALTVNIMHPPFPFSHFEPISNTTSTYSSSASSHHLLSVNVFDLHYLLFLSSH
jgi:hypothetical protein